MSSCSITSSSSSSSSISGVSSSGTITTISGRRADPSQWDSCVERLPSDEALTYRVFASFGMALSVAMLLAIARWRRTRTLHAASSLFCALIALGASLVFTSSLLAVWPRTTHTCAANVWLLHLGFSLAFGALFTKTWRLVRIFNVSFQS